jgi:excisionase family DNA binding protein
MRKKPMLLTTKQVAEMTGISVSHIRRMIREGELKAEKMGIEYFVTETQARRVERKRRPRSNG